MNAFLEILFLVAAVSLGCSALKEVSFLHRFRRQATTCSDCCYFNFRLKKSANCTQSSCQSKCEKALKAKRRSGAEGFEDLTLSTAEHFVKPRNCKCRCYYSTSERCNLNEGYLPFKPHPESQASCSRCFRKKNSPPDPETACQSVTGTFSTSTNSCFKFFDGNYTRDQAEQLCTTEAPTGLRGRLAVIPDQQVFNLVFDLKGEERRNRFWFGLKAKDPQSVTNGFAGFGRKTFRHADEWAFFDGDQIVAEFSFFPFTMFVDQHSPCIRVDINMAYNDLPCNSTAKAMCEFVQP